jgi:two-component system cell cycle sensor histidine kinase/response regulator CckA
LPLSEKPAVRSATPSGGTILLVEDYGKVRDLAKNVLVRHGYEVLTAGSGDDALAICTAYEGAIDVLVTDVNMAGMTGPELAKRIVAIRSDIAVLYMSGYAGDVLDGHDRSGGTSFIGKPFTPADLAQKVRELVLKTPTR